MLPHLQEHVDAGLEVGWHVIDEWVLLGGTEPTPEENVRSVVERMRAASA